MLAEVDKVLQIRIISVLVNCGRHELVKLVVEPVFVDEGENASYQFGEEYDSQDYRKLVEKTLIQNVLNCRLITYKL